MASRNIYEQTFDEDVQQNEHNTCPECNGRVTANSHETVCDDCGLVVDDQELDRGPEWREFENDNGGRRVGSPNTVSRHDRGIGTEIGRKQDFKGRELDGDKRRQLNRLRREHKRAKVGSKADQNRITGFTEIRRMTAALGLPESVRDQACQLFRSAQDAGLLVGRSIEAVASGSLYAVCRLNEHPRSFEAIARVSKISKDRIRTGYTVMNRDLDLPVPPAGPEQYLAQVASAADVSRSTQRRARSLLNTANEAQIANGRNPLGAAAGALYLASQETGEFLNQQELADAANVSTPTVRERYRDLEDVVN
jgi:transcription initiation factor TFIIB